jgi:hypothetical protein
LLLSFFLTLFYSTSFQCTCYLWVAFLQTFFNLAVLVFVLFWEFLLFISFFLSALFDCLQPFFVLSSYLGKFSATYSNDYALFGFYSLSLSSYFFSSLLYLDCLFCGKFSFFYSFEWHSLTFNTILVSVLSLLFFLHLFSFRTDCGSLLFHFILVSFALYSLYFLYTQGFSSFLSVFLRKALRSCPYLPTYSQSIHFLYFTLFYLFLWIFNTLLYTAPLEFSDSFLIEFSLLTSLFQLPCARFVLWAFRYFYLLSAVLSCILDYLFEFLILLFSLFILAFLFG